MVAAVAGAQQVAGSRQVRVLPASAGLGGCFGPGSLCGTPRSVLGEEGEGHGLVVVALLEVSLPTLLGAPGAPPALLWLEEAALAGASSKKAPPLRLAYRLGSAVRTRALPIKPGKLIRHGSVVSLPPKPYAVVEAAASGLLPALGRLAAELQGHPGLLEGPEGVEACLSAHELAVVPQSDGLLLLAAAHPGSGPPSLRRALLRFEFSPPGLALVPLEAATLPAAAFYGGAAAVVAAGRPVTSFAEAAAAFSNAAGSPNGAAGAGASVWPMASVRRPFTSITPRTEVQLLAPTSPGVGAVADSSLSEAVATLQGHPLFSTSQAIAHLAKGCEAAGDRADWWAGPSIEADVLELLVGSHSSLAGGVEGGAVALQAAQVVVLAIAGSAPERAAAEVGDRLARSAQEALSAAGPPAVGALLQLLVEAISLPAVAAAAGRCGLAEDLIALYIDYSEQMYEGATVAGAKKGKRADAPYDATLNPFSTTDDGSREGLLVANWGSAMWAADADTHSRSAVTVGRPAPPAQSIPEDAIVASVANSSKSALATNSNGGGGTPDSDAGRGDPPSARAFSKPPASSPGSGSKPHVPRLALPSPGGGGGLGQLAASGSGGAATPAATGLTRSSRRAAASLSGSSRQGHLLSPVRASLNFPLAGDAPGGASGGGGLSAGQDLASLGRTLGESLIAADLGALVVHKRMRGVIGGGGRISSASSMAGELPSTSELPSPAGGAGWHWPADLFQRAATGRRYSASSAPSPPSSAARSGPAEPRVVSLKCAILEVLLQLDGLGLGRTGPNGDWSPGVRSPANLLACELAATDPGGRLEARPPVPGEAAGAGDALPPPRPLLCTGRLRTLVVAATHVLDAGAAASAAAAEGAASQRSRARQPPAVLMRVRGVLMQLLDQRPGAPGTDPALLDHLTVQLQVLHEWLAAGCAPGLAEEVVALCGEQLLAAKALLRRWRVATWARGHLCLMHALLRLLGLLAQRAASSPLLGRWLLAGLLEAEDSLALLQSYTRGPLFGSTDKTPPGIADFSPAEVFSMRLAALRFWAALVELVGRQPAAQAGAEAQPRGRRQPSSAFHPLPSLSTVAGAAPLTGDDELVGGLSAGQLGTQSTARSSLPASSARTACSDQLTPGRGFTRRAALQSMSFLVDVSNGVVLRVLERIHESGQVSQEQVGNMHRAALDILAAAFAVPGCPLVADKRLVDFYVHYHFLNFVKLYHTMRGAHHLALARGHLAVLAALSGHKGGHMVRRFFQLRVCDFLVRELSLEFECHAAGAAQPWGSRPSSSRPTNRSAISSARLSGRQAPDPDGGSSSRMPSDRYTLIDAAPSSGHRPGQERPRGVPPLRGFVDKAAAASSGCGPKPPIPVPVPPPGPPPTGGAAPSHHRTVSAPNVRSHMISLDPTPMHSSRDPLISSRGQASSRTRALSMGTALAGLPQRMASLRESQASRAAPDSARSGATAGGSRAHDGDGPLDPLPGSSPGTSRELSMSSSSSGEGAPLPEGVQFTGDLEDDLAMLEEMEGSDSDSDCSSSSSSDSGCSPTPRDPQASVAIPRLSIPVRSQSMATVEVPQLSLGPLGQGAEEAPLGAEGSLGQLQKSMELDGKLQVALTQSVKQRAAQSSRAQGSKSPKAAASGAAPPPGPAFVRSASRIGNSAAGGPGPPEPGSPTAHSTSRSSLQDTSVNYADECMLRGLYRDPELHLLVLQVVLELLVSKSGQLSPLYCSQNPHELHKQNIPMLLHHHLNYPDNAWLLPRLLEAAHRQGPSSVMLLRLLAAPLFSGGLYAATQRIARGAYSTVFRCSLPALGPGTPATLALKVVDMPDSIHDHCNHVDVFNEVNILHSLSGVPGVCQMYDFGISRDSFCLVLKDYRCNLLEWRKRQPKEPARQLRLYLKVFQQVCSAVQELHRRGVVHFDLKCDNVMLAPLPGISDEDFWHPPGDELTFEIALSDFGESKMTVASKLAADAPGSPGGGHHLTVRNRGTEYIKSPEMLMVANAHKKGRDTYDRRKREGAGAASDVWSMGCLLAEVVLGDWLFYDPDWIRFFIRLTRSGEELIPPERRAALRGLPVVLELMEYILVRDPSRRPSLPDVALRAATLFRNAQDSMPPYSRPPPWVASTQEMGAITGAPPPPGEAFFRGRGAVVGGEPAGPWAAFYNTGAPTLVAPGLALSTAAAALRPGRLAEMGVSAVLLLRPALTRVSSSTVPQAAQLAGVAQASGIDLLQLQLPADAASPLLLELLPKALAFMGASGALWAGPPDGRPLLARAARDPCVLIASAAAELAGDAAAIAAAALLERLRSPPYPYATAPGGSAGVYEAATLLGWRRLGLGLAPSHLAALAKWHDARLRAVPLPPPGAPTFSCPCGACRASLSSPLEQAAGPNPAHACAAPLAPGGPAGCPADCAAIAAQRAGDGGGGEGVRWARAAESTVCFDPLAPAEEVRVGQGAAPAVAPGWTLFRCAACGHVTHARKDGQLAIVADLQAQGTAPGHPFRTPR